MFFEEGYRWNKRRGHDRARLYQWRRLWYNDESMRKLWWLQNYMLPSRPVQRCRYQWHYVEHVHILSSVGYNTHIEVGGFLNIYFRKTRIGGHQLISRSSEFSFPPHICLQVFKLSWKKFHDFLGFRLRNCVCYITSVHYFFPDFLYRWIGADWILTSRKV